MPIFMGRYEYCPICGEKYKGGHECSERTLSAINAADTRAFRHGSPKLGRPSLSTQLQEGGNMLDDEDPDDYLPTPEELRQRHLSRKEKRVDEF